MATVLLIRHAAVAASAKRLYGTTPGVHLSEEGLEQARRLADRLRPVPLAALYASPLERCLETAAPILEGRGLEAQVLPELGEVETGDWTGRSFASLSRLGAWRLSRTLPSAFGFPGGETLAEVQRRVVEALRTVAALHGREVIALVSHGDPIRLAVAHFAGIHLDLFQRLDAAPASVSAVSLGGGPPAILRLNDTGTLADLAPKRRRPQPPPRA